MSFAQHFTDDPNPPQLWPAAIRMNCGKVIDDAVPKDWVLVDETCLCRKCVAKARQEREYWTFWTRGQALMDGAA